MKEARKSSIYCYRTINLPLFASNVPENILFDTIYSLVRNTLRGNQNGYREKRSTVLELLSFSSKLYEYYNDTTRELTVLSLDFEEAFERVPQCLLISNLSKIGVTNKILSLVSSYLTKAVHVWIEQICANMQYVTEIEVKWQKKTRLNQCLQKPSIFKHQCFWTLDMSSILLVLHGRLRSHLATRCRTGAKT